jgi:hypothetical protein
MPPQSSTVLGHVFQLHLTLSGNVYFYSFAHFFKPLFCCFDLVNELPEVLAFDQLVEPVFCLLLLGSIKWQFGDAFES